MKYLDKDGLSHLWSKLKAKLSDKQDKLTSQTAYSSKGSATKVPQITTNSLGQVTGISEVTITQPTVNNGTLTIQKNGTNVQTFTANQSSNVTADITVPTKTSDLTNDSDFVTSSGTVAKADQLSTARTIGVGTAVSSTPMPFVGTQNVTIPINDVKEAYNVWGGRNISGNVSPNDAGCIDEFGHNKLAFLPAECITVEYTTDGGTTWLDYGLTAAQKIAMVTTSGANLTIGKGTVRADQGTLTNANCKNYKVRVLISTRKIGQSGGVLYTSSKKWLLNVTTNGANGAKVLIEDRTIANYNNNVDTWRTVGTYGVAGWSGWNSIPYSTSFGGGVNQTGQVAQIRFTLSIDSVNTNYACTAAFIDFRLIGTTNWSMPSELARAGHLYKVDTDMRAIFPNDVRPETNNSKTLGTTDYKWSNVYATTFTGNLTGTATKATGDKNGNDITTTYYKASNPNGYTSNTGTITKVQANGTDVASSGTANIPAATTGAYGVTKLSSATDSTSTTLAATPSAVKAAFDNASNKLEKTYTIGPQTGNVQWVNQFDYAALVAGVTDNDTGQYFGMLGMPGYFENRVDGTYFNITPDGFNLVTTYESEGYSQLHGIYTDIDTSKLVITDVKTPTDDYHAANKKYVDDNVPTNSQIVDLIYPVGSIYLSVNSTSPATLFGGTWVQLKDNFLLGAGDTYTNGATGGEATHTLTEQEMPAHTHAGQRHYQATSSSTGYSSSWTSQKYTIENTGSKGGGQPHNNMPPYLVVYMWKRTA